MSTNKMDDLFSQYEKQAKQNPKKSEEKKEEPKPQDDQASKEKVEMENKVKEAVDNANIGYEGLAQDEIKGMENDQSLDRPKEESKKTDPFAMFEAKASSPRPTETKSEEKVVVTSSKTVGESKIVDPTEMIDSSTGELNFVTPEEVSDIEIWGYSGEKGAGKTSAICSHPGEKVIIAFDRKSAVTWKHTFGSDPSVKIIEPFRLIRKGDEIQYLKTCHEAINFVGEVLDKLIDQGGVDWVVIDGADFYAEMAEGAMRHKHHVTLTQGLKRHLWKLRNLFMDQIHDTAVLAVKRGLIYTTYPYNEIVSSKDDEEEVRKKPNWAKYIEREVDNLIVLTTGGEEDRKKYYVNLYDMKTGYKNGMTIDVTADLEAGELPSTYKIINEKGKIKK